MNGWIAFALYVVAWLISGTLLTRRILIGMEKEGAIDRSDRGMAVFGGFGLSLLAPVLPVLAVGAYDLLTTRTRLFHTPWEVAVERANRDAAELAEYRRLAAEYDLPTPKMPR